MGLMSQEITKDEELIANTPDDFTLSGGLPKADAVNVDQGMYIDWEAGDSLTSASRETGIPVALLQEWNGGSEKVFAGESLRIPDDFELQDTVEPAPEVGDRAALDAAVIEMRRKEAAGLNSTEAAATQAAYYAKDDQDFLAYGGTEEPLVATPSTAITETEELLTQAPVASLPNTHPPGSIDVRLTGWDNLAGLESDTLHVDHTGVITMGWGVVPDGGVTLDGKDINVKKDHGLTSTSTLSGVDTSKAYKKVNGVTYKREDYTTDLAFSQAVYTGFYESAKANVDNFDDLTDEHKEVIIDLGYNAGETAFTKWNDTDTLAKELVKDVEDRTITNLTQFTDNFAAGGMFGGGVLRRRALSANKVLGEDDQIAYIEQGDDISGTTKFTLKRSDGTTVREWDRETSKVNAYPAGKPILTIDGERKASYAPRQAKVDLTDWANIIV